MSASVLTNSREDGRYRASLKTLSDRELLSGLEGLHGTEREAQLKILYNLIEVDQRRLYLLLGFGSLFEFCTDPGIHEILRGETDTRRPVHGSVPRVFGAVPPVYGKPYIHSQR